MFTFFGLLASIYAGWRADDIWGQPSGIIAGIFGITISLSTDIGPLLVIGAAWWLHKKADDTTFDEFQDMDELLETELDSPDGHPDPADGWQRGGSSPPTPGRDSRPDDVGSPPGSSDGRNSADDPSDGERDPYSIEW